MTNQTTDIPVQIVLKARTPAIGEMVEACAMGTLGFDELCRRVAAMGYRTTSLYEMVRAAEWESENAR